MKKGVLKSVTLVLVSFVFMSCMSSVTYRPDTSTPMQESCIVTSTIGATSIQNYRVYRLENNEFVKEKALEFVKEKNNILSAGRYIISGTFIKIQGTGEYQTRLIDRGTYYETQTVEYIRYDRTDVVGIFDFEPGGWYELSFRYNIADVFPTETEGTYIDSDDNLYLSSMCTIYARIGNSYYVYKLDSRKIEDKQFGKTLSIPEYSSNIYFGMRHLNMLGFQFGNSYGFAYFSDPLNLHVNGEWGLGIGMGFAEYDVSSFDNFMNNIGVGLPFHIGGTVEFDFYKKWSLGLGGGYLLTPLPPQGIFGTPYVQAILNRIIYIDYYFTPGEVIYRKPVYDDEGNEIKLGTAPLYSAFGLGAKLSF